MKAVLRQAPNILSALRLIAAPIAAWLILNDRDVAALCVFVVAGLSDAADGFLAKKFGLASRFGAWLDPAADKLLMLASFVSLTAVGAVPLWLTMMVIGRDIVIVLGVLLARVLAMPLEVKPLMVGKVSTVAQVLYIALVLFLMTLPGFDPYNPHPIEILAEAAVTALTAASFFSYAWVWLAAAFRRVPQGDGTV